LLFHLPFSSNILPHAWSVSTYIHLHLLTTPIVVLAETALAFLLLCYWQVWKQRNNMVFDRVPPSSLYS
jgi:hypothetical protein